jgi:hypothetical protein
VVQKILVIIPARGGSEGVPRKNIRSVSPWIKLFHLSDNNGLIDLGLPFDEGAWFKPVIKHLPDVPCVIETYVSGVPILLKQLELVTRWQSY